MKITKGIVVLFIAFLLLIVVSFFIFNKNNKGQEIVEVVVEEEIFDCDSIDYSRISLFNASKDRVSLNIPANWEGNYRLKEEGSQAIFYYLSKDGSASEMFSLRKGGNSNEVDKIICSKNDLNFSLDSSSLEIAEYYSDISNEFLCVKKSIKCD